MKKYFFLVFFCLLVFTHTTSLAYSQSEMSEMSDFLTELKDSIETITQLPDQSVDSVQSKVDSIQLQKGNPNWPIFKHILLFVLVLLVQYILIRLTNYGFRKLILWVDSTHDRYLKPIYIRKYEFLSVNREKQIVFFLLKIIRYIFIAIQLIISVPILFSIFPQTEHLAMQIFSYIFTPVKKIVWNVINYIPKLFVIAVIWMIVRSVVKGIGYLATEIEKKRLRIPGFYSDWAQPTFSIIRFLLYVFMIILIFPYLPNSNSKIFQGFSIFFGLIVSFGSSSAIGNLVSGMIITYMRPFQIGDRIKINDVTGSVIERTPIVTRIRTLKNEIVTIPNSTVINSQSTNLSESARTNGLIVHFNVACGYDTPWRTVHQLLIEAAENTEGVESNPHPFVLEKPFADFYAVYEINACIKNAHKLEEISSRLRGNVQDKFREAGVSIISPHYYLNAIPKMPKNDGE